MKYQVKSFRVLLAHDVTGAINIELENRGLDARDIISIAHYHQAVIVYYGQKMAEGQSDNPG